MIDKVYVLNLDRKVDNWNRVNKLLLSKGIVAQRWSALDGKTVEFFTNYWVNRLQSKNRIENFGALACGLSHIEILKDAIANNYDKIVVFEDDVYLHKNFSLDNLSDADLLYLGATQQKWKGDEASPYYKAEGTMGTFAMVIKKTLFQPIIDAWTRQYGTIDEVLAKHIQPKYDCKVMYPNLVACDVRDSDIREPWDLVHFAAIVNWNLSDYGLGERNLLEQTTFLVNSKSLNNGCVDSIKAVWPNAKIQLINSGPITTDYVIPCQPNYYFGQDTQIDKLFGFLENKFEYGGIGGSVHTVNDTIHNCITLTEKDGIVIQKSAIARFEQYKDLMYKTCDKTSLFGMYRNLPNISNLLKDSTSFFWNLKKEGEWKIAHTGQVLITQSAN